MNIGQVAARSGVPAKTIRYYEDSGLIRPASRTEAGYRVYSEADVHTLRLIGRARDLGFSVESVRRLLALWQDKNRSSAEVKTLALEHVEALQRKISELEALKHCLLHLADHCHGDERPECPILDDLSGEKGSEVQKNSPQDPPARHQTRGRRQVAATKLHSRKTGT